MKLILHLAVVAVCLLAGANESVATGIIPNPLQALEGEGTFEVTEDNILSVQAGNGGALRVGQYLADEIHAATDVEHEVVQREGDSGENVIRLTFEGADAGLGPEGYVLVIATNAVVVRSTGEAGLFYGVQTLRQLAPLSGSWVWQAMTIRDKPRFAWRGLMLDLARHFHGPDTIRRYMDLLALHKMNRLHLHLTDDQGWRIEIKSRPKLTTVGAVGNRSDKEAPAAFLTQEDVRDLLAYAKQRHIMVIPEIDMPGHSKAAVRSYPEIGIEGDNKLNPGLDEAYTFVGDVLGEVARLFDAPYVHIGGDEVGRRSWESDPDVKAKMNALGLANSKELERHFTREVATILDGLDRRLMGWDEVADAGLPDSAVVHWWRHDKPGKRDLAVSRGHQVVCSPREPAYFDYMQDLSHPHWGWQLKNTLDKVYNWEPVPDTYDDKQRALILGVQANVWTERIATREKLDFMVFPRLAAMAEVGWTDPGRRDVEDFKKRLDALKKIYAAGGVNFYRTGDPFPRR